ncbi:MAG: glycosyltransferase [Thermodesulfovibrionaceae bacterium]
MLSIIISFLVSFFICLFIIRYAHILGHRLLDPTERGPQKFHENPTPRTGGLAILGGIIASALVFLIQKKDFALDFLIILLCSLPAFLAGFAEDLTKKVSARTRLLLCSISAILIFLFANVHILRVDIPFLDDIVKLIPFSFILSTVAIVGLSNAINIIDGFNGLASGVSIIILVGLAYVAFKVNDTFILFSCIVLIATIFGFFIWNYPRGFIFLGDGGAYLLGVLIGTFSVLLVKRNEQISAWFPMLLLIYPVWETLFSIYRKKFLKRMSPLQPDGLHFHMLVYKRIVKWAVGPKDAKYITRRNSATSVYLWGLTFISFIPAVLFWKKTQILQICVFLWIFMYVLIYRKIVKFKFFNIKGNSKKNL